MHLITALVAGIKGAENGTAEIYSRGTTTRATYYSDFEGTSADSSGADVDLDSNGGAVIYVNEYVTVIAKSSSGGTIRTFTDGVSGNAVEIISDSFTGTDYTDGSSAVSEPIALTPVLDKWNDSAGAADWKVDVGGTATNISSAVGGLAGIFFNVKDSAYGALGDGTTDDTTAIETAIAAATVAGGTVYFPAGTYRTTTDIAVDGDVVLMGAGPDASQIKVDSAANADGISLSAATKGLQKVIGLSFTCAQANTGSFIAISASARVVIQNCHFLGTNITGQLIDANTASPDYLLIKDCVFEPTALGNQSIDSKAAGCFVVGCTFVVPSTYTSQQIRLINGSVVGNIFDVTAVSNSGGTGVRGEVGTANQKISVIGNYFTEDGGASTFKPLTASDADGDTAASTAFVEHGNVYGTSFGDPDGTTASDISSFDSTKWLNIYYGSRKGKIFQHTNVQASATIYPTRSEIILLDITDNGNYTFTPSNLPPPGSRLIMVFVCSIGGGSGNLILGSGFASDALTKTLLALHDVNIYEFICCPVELTDGSIELRLVEFGEKEALQIAP